MNCPTCGAKLEDDAKFCVTCGYQLEQAKSGKGANAAKKTPGFIIGMIVGTLLIIVGFIRIVTAGTSISSTSFGGDFYTYTYQGIVAVSELLASVEASLGWLIIAIGAAIDVFSLRAGGGR